jgi:8-oxo-dGTP diphosphatase
LTSSGSSAAVPADHYVASLARKRMAAGALFRDEAGRVPLVEPTYKDNWEVPGGAVEQEESPTAACRREVLEELGLDRPVGRVLAVDWVPSRPERPEGLMLIYDGGMLRSARAAIRRGPGLCGAVGGRHERVERPSQRVERDGVPGRTPEQ